MVLEWLAAHQSNMFAAEGLLEVVRYDYMAPAELLETVHSNPFCR